MKTADFTYLMQNPNLISKDQIGEVRSVIDEFPYFQPARAIYLKGLKNSESFRYNQELRVTAAYTTDRSVLFDFITSDEFAQDAISDQIKQNFERLKNIEIIDMIDLSSDQSAAIDQAMKQHVQHDLETLQHEIEHEDVLHFDPIIQDSEPAQLSPEEKLEIGKPLEFDQTEKHSFTEWLKITSFKPIVRTDGEKKTGAQLKSSTKERKEELIEKFIQTNPRIQPVEEQSGSRNIAKSQMLKPESLMTETLARIYLEQKNYEKAIQAYKILSLKYPEKSGFFADQIQAIKELKEQNK